MPCQDVRDGRIAAVRRDGLILLYDWYRRRKTARTCSMPSGRARGNAGTLWRWSRRRHIPLGQERQGTGRYETAVFGDAGLDNGAHLEREPVARSGRGDRPHTDQDRLAGPRIVSSATVGVVGRAVRMATGATVPPPGILPQNRVMIHAITMSH